MFCVWVCSLALVIHRAQRMRSTTLPPVTSLAVPCLYTLSHKSSIFDKEMKIKCAFWSSAQPSVQHFTL